MLEVHESAVDMIDQERAAPATLLPPRTEHEVVHDQLASAAEEVGERLLPFRSVKHVILLDLDPGQFTPLSAQLIAQPGEFLFPCQMGLAGNKPVVA